MKPTARHCPVWYFACLPIEPNARKNKKAILGPCRICLVNVYAKLGESLLGFLRIKLAVTGQPRKRCGGNRFSVDFKVPPQMLPVVASSEAVSPQRYQPVAQPGRQLVRDRL